ncbi:synaptic vesicle membrane protein VAT-1 homolog-like [Frankliniella occidentalis]|uniref:Synaptic vesicle membrane protein VAT-1 homolog-like n=1 Tax=Frankliniella occidentalis TaxID=133901 RepID=A0A9C6X6N9_FRAOC|nr:synaptic vesicle membrane protein VAT-1 homolog-like [Frankliniella occidentalis]
MAEENQKPAEEQKPEQQEKAEEKQEAAAKDEQESAEKTPEEPPKEMRAVVLTGFGGLKSVKLLKKPEPTLAEGEVLIRVKACGLNFQDLMVRVGAIDSPPKTPVILGFECAGEIEAVGEGVEDFKVGDRVVALPEYRAWAELVAVPAKYVYRLPADMSFLDASAIAINYAVAYMLLFDVGNLQPGKVLLVHSVGGGVGQAVCQLARTVEGVKIIGVASKAKHEAIQGSIDHIIERGTDYASEVRKLYPEGVDIVLDCLCGEECNRGYSLIKPMGKYVLYGSANVVTGETKSIFSVAKSWWQVDKVSPIKLFDENKTLAGLNMRHLMYQQGGAAHIKSVMDKVFALWSKGKVKAVIDSTWALEDVPEAMQKMHDRKNVGKILLDPSMEPKPKPATPAKGKGKSSSIDKEDKKKDEEENGSGDNDVKDEEKKKDDKKDDKKEEKKESS